MRDVLFSTVGTSLFSNIARENAESLFKAALDKGNWLQLAKQLATLDPENHLCGAEINSICSICKKGKINAREDLVFAISDTDAGRGTGETLKQYYSDNKNPFRFGTVTVAPIIGLRDDDVKAFRNQGLRNLVKEVARIVRKYGKDRVAVNATGGYKAQIAFAGLVSQAMEIPVYYMFERFSEVIELPPQPIAMSFDLWLENYSLLNKLDKQLQIDKSDLDQPMDERLLSLIDEEAINHRTYIALSPVGQLFHESFRYRFANQKQNILPTVVAQGKRVEPASDKRLLGNEHLNHLGVTKLMPFLTKLFVATPYVRGFHCYYTNPDLSETTRFEVGHEGGRRFVNLIYEESGKVAKLEVETESGDAQELLAAVADLTERFFS